MIVTEEEAKQLWCPEAGANMRLAGEPAAQARCIGSGCMAWRWYRPEANLAEVTSTAHSMGFTKSTGYCGKAGKP